MTLVAQNQRWYNSRTITEAVAIVLGVIVAIALITHLTDGGSAKPPATADAADSDTPKQTVTAYYNALDRKDFSAAWNLVSPNLKGARTLDAFKAGYATTQSVHVSVDDEPGEPQRVHTSLDATDLVSGSVVHSHFEGWWKVTRGSNGRWLLDDAHMVKTW